MNWTFVLNCIFNHVEDVLLVRICSHFEWPILPFVVYRECSNCSKSYWYLLIPGHMADPGTQAATADPGTPAAMAEQGARAAMAEQGAWDASMAEQGAWDASVAEQEAWEAMEGSPPPKILLGKLPISGGRSGSAEGALDRTSGGQGELDGTSGVKGELDGTSGGPGELDGDQRGQR